MFDLEYNAYLDYILHGEPEPFCPFPGEMNSGYCDVAYSYHCTSCPYAQKAWAEYRKEYAHEEIHPVR